MTMTNSGVRVLKAGDVGHDAIVSVSPAHAKTRQTSPSDGPAIFTAAEVENLCAEARSGGAAEAAVALEEPLQRIAAGLIDLSTQEVAVLSTARRADAETIASAAIEVARWVIGRELQDEGSFLNVVEQAIAKSGDNEVLRVLVHPDLADVLAEIAPEGLAISGDTSIAPGDFKIETDGPDISLRIESALAIAQAELVVREDA